MRAFLTMPHFWRAKPDAAGLFFCILLAPLGWIYATIVSLRLAVTKPKQVAPVVLCVGNAVAGGTGKTPVCLALGRRAVERGIKVHFLTRGYGGREAGPVAVDPARHRAEDVGDEALLLATIAPTWVSADRVAGAKQAEAAGAELIIMDDGLQNPALQKTYSVLTVDGSFGFGNKLPMPAGPMREFSGSALKRVNRCVVVGPADGKLEAELAAERPLSRARLVPSDSFEPFANRPVVAFAGIGRPEKFFAMLSDAGLMVTDTIGFADHHAYTDRDIVRLRERATECQAVLLTTVKDFVRLPGSFQPDVTAVPVELKFENGSDCDVILDEALANG